MCRQGPGAAPCLRLDSPLQSSRDRPRSERRENIIRKEAGRKEEGQWRGSPGNIKGSKNGGGERTESEQENAKEKCTCPICLPCFSFARERERKGGRGKGGRELVFLSPILSTFHFCLLIFPSPFVLPSLPISPPPLPPIPRSNSPLSKTVNCTYCRHICLSMTRTDMAYLPWTATTMMSSRHERPWETEEG